MYSVPSSAVTFIGTFSFLKLPLLTFTSVSFMASPFPFIETFDVSATVTALMLLKSTLFDTVHS